MYVPIASTQINIMNPTRRSKFPLGIFENESGDWNSKGFLSSQTSIFKWQKILFTKKSVHDLDLARSSQKVRTRSCRWRTAEHALHAPTYDALACSADSLHPGLISKAGFIFIDGQEASSGRAAYGVIEHKWHGEHAASVGSVPAARQSPERRPHRRLRRTNTPRSQQHPSTANPHSSQRARSHACLCRQPRKRSFMTCSSIAQPAVARNVMSTHIASQKMDSSSFRAADLGRPVQC
jgi:hypothetical protein